MFRPTAFVSKPALASARRCCPTCPAPRCSMQLRQLNNYCGASSIHVWTSDRLGSCDGQGAGLALNVWVGVTNNTLLSDQASRTLLPLALRFATLNCSSSIFVVISMWSGHHTRFEARGPMQLRHVNNYLGASSTMNTTIIVVTSDYEAWRILRVESYSAFKFVTPVWSGHHARFEACKLMQLRHKTNYLGASSIDASFTAATGVLDTQLGLLEEGSCADYVISVWSGHHACLKTRRLMQLRHINHFLGCLIDHERVLMA